MVEWIGDHPKPPNTGQGKRRDMEKCIKKITNTEKCGDVEYKTETVYRSKANAVYEWLSSGFSLTGIIFIVIMTTRLNGCGEVPIEDCTAEQQEKVFEYAIGCPSDGCYKAVIEVICGDKE